MIEPVEYWYAMQVPLGSFVVFRVTGTLATPSYETVMVGLSFDEASELQGRLNMERSMQRSKELSR